MGPLESARELAATLPSDNHNGECVFCEGPFLCAGDDESQWRIEHRPDCPWLAMPQIVAALEAAREFVDESPLQTDDATWTCAFCHAEQPDTPLTDDEPFSHDAECPWQALTRALKGESA